MEAAQLLAACSAVLLLAGIATVHAAETGTPLITMGFHEGSRRSVRCNGKDGFFKGIAAHFAEDSYTYDEPYVTGVQFICSSGEVLIQYVGKKDDTTVFGHEVGQQVSAECNRGIAGLQWRQAKYRTAEGGEIRVGGVAVMCYGENGSVVQGGVLQKKAGDFPKKFSCKDVPEYKALDRPRIHFFDIWQSAKGLAGFEPMNCTQTF